MLIPFSGLGRVERREQNKRTGCARARRRSPRPDLCRALAPRRHKQEKRASYSGVSAVFVSHCRHGSLTGVPFLVVVSGVSTSERPAGRCLRTHGVRFCWWRKSTIARRIVLVRWRIRLRRASTLRLESEL